MDLAARARAAEALLKTFQLFERRQQRPGLRPVAVGSIRDQPHNAMATAISGFKAEDRLDRACPGPRQAARRGAIRIDLEISGDGTSGKGTQLLQDRSRAVEGLQLPTQGQHVAPEAVRKKQRFQRVVTGLAERALELCEPGLGKNRDVFGLVQHARPLLSASPWAQRIPSAGT